MRQSGKHLNPYRKSHPTMGPSPPGALYGFFLLRIGKVTLAVISSGERYGEQELEQWEHVSVSIYPQAKRLPTWDEMQAVKDLFWMPSETVVQFHPAESEYVNVYQCLHLWKPPYELKLPPTLALAMQVTGR